MPDLEKKELAPFAITFSKEWYNVLVSVNQVEGKTYLAIATPEGIGTAIKITDQDVFKLKTALDF